MGAWPYAAAVFALMLIYLLSYGPVLRHFAKVTENPPTTTATADGSVYMISVTFEMPGWVAALYHPAWLISENEWGDRTYGAYLRWWWWNKEDAARRKQEADSPSPPASAQP